MTVPFPRQQLAKSMSMPSLQHKSAGSDFRATAPAGGFGAGSPGKRELQMALSGGTGSPQKMKMNLSMSQTFSPGGSLRDQQRITGRMVMQQGCWGLGPPKTDLYTPKHPRGVWDKQHVFEVNKAPATSLRRYFERGDLPISMKHGAQLKLEWKVEPDKLDYTHFLPIFFDGLLEKTNPYATIAYVGLEDMLKAARGKEPSVIAPAVPLVIVPLKRCFNTKDITVMCRAINMLQLMLRCDMSIGEMLVPYYRQILPTFNIFRHHNLNLGDGIEYSQRKRENIGDLITETLELLERTGGEDAFINIKYIVPSYESVLL